MRSRGLAALAAAWLCLAGTAQADTADEAFWKSVSASGNAAELNAYLQAFPHGQFVSLARIRLQAMSQSAARPASAATPAASILIHKTQYRAVDTIAVQVDIGGLRNGSNFRIAVMPARTPDSIGDLAAFTNDSIEINDPVERIVLPPGVPGHDEVRVYYIPQFETSFHVAVRAAIDVGPATPGAMSLHAMTLTILNGNEDDFVAAHDGKTWTVEGQYGGSEFANGVYNVGVDYEDLQPDFRDHERPPTQIVCVMAPILPVTPNQPAPPFDVEARIKKLRKGDPIVLTGTDAKANTTSPDALVMHNCAFAK